MSEAIRGDPAATPSSAAGPRLRAVRLALDLVTIALLAVYLWAFVPRNVSLQWDARTYRLAARTAITGGNPYDLRDLAAASRAGRAAMPFLYPPIAITPFLPLAALPREAALGVWLGLKLALLAGLVVLWKRLAPRVEWLPLALTAVFGCNAAALWDLRSGNVAIVEAALVWAGLAALVAGRRGRFAALIVLASCFKLVPAALLLLLLVPVGPRPPHMAERRRTLAIAALALVLLVVAPFFVGPARAWHGFLTNVSHPIPVGAANPGLLAMLLTLSRDALGAGAAAGGLAIAAWLAALALIFAASRRWLAEAWRARDAWTWAFAAAWLLPMLAPRPMAYGLVMLLPAPLALAPPRFATPTGRLLLALALSAQGLSRAANIPAEGPILAAAPVLLPLAIWLLLVRGAPAPRAARRA